MINEKPQRFIFMCNLLKNLLSFDVLGKYISKFRCFENSSNVKNKITLFWVKKFKKC